MAPRSSREGSHLGDKRSVEAYQIADIQEKRQKAGQIAIADEYLRVPPDDCRVQPVQDSLGAVASTGSEDRPDISIFEQDPEFLASLEVLSGEKTLPAVQESWEATDPEAQALQKAGTPFECLGIERT
jgi:hypothetical protein